MDAPSPPPPASVCGTLEVELRRLDRSYAHLRVIEPGAQARLCASLAREGQLHPVLVVWREAQRAVLIDGYRRVLGLAQLKHDTATALVLPLSEPEALAYWHRMQTGSRRSALEDGWLIAELAEHGQSLAPIGTGLDRSVSWVSRRLGLCKALPAGATAAVRRGVVPAHGAMKSLVPLARANKAHCDKLCEQLGAAPVTTRQLGLLYAAYRAGDASVRERIANAPRLFLEAQRAVTRPEPGGVAGALVRDLKAAQEVLARAADSARRAWSLEPPCLHDPTVVRAVSQCTQAYEALLRHLEEPDAEAE